MSESITENKSFQFAVRIVNLYKYLTKEKNEYVLSKQLLRSGTSIGANVSEGERAQSKADFYAKMSIALKEANETYYWLKLLYETDYLTEKEFLSVEIDVNELISLLVSIIKNSSAFRTLNSALKSALVAQLDRASDSDSEGRWFDSSQARQK